MKVADKKRILWENIKIIFGNKCINLFNDMERNSLNLNDCLNKAKENGYVSGTIIVLSESYLEGEVYRYGNYQDDKWYQIGKLEGFT